MRFNSEDRDISFVGTISPKHSSRCRRFVFEVRLENSEATLPTQSINFVRGQAVVTRILAQIRQRLYQLPVKLLLFFIQLIATRTIYEIIPFSFHPRYTHPDVESHC